MEVVAEAIRGDDKKDLGFLTVVLVHAPISDLDLFRFQLLPCAVDVGYENGCAFIAGVAAINGEPDSNAVALQYYRRRRDCLAVRPR